MEEIKLTPVEVEWLDAQTWMGTSEEFGEVAKWKPVISYTCGYLIHEGKEQQDYYKWFKKKRTGGTS